MRPSAGSYSLSGSIALFVGLAAAGCGGGGGGGSSLPLPQVTPTPIPTPTAVVSALCSNKMSVGSQVSGAGGGTLAMRYPARTQGAVEADKIAVRFESARYSDAAAAELTKLGATPVSSINARGAMTFEIPGGADPYSAAAAMRGQPGVVAASPVVLRNALQTPNDPDFGFPKQWNLLQIGMPDAWSITTGSPAIKIAVVDTGYDMSHVDLAGKVTQSAVFDLGKGIPDPAETAQDNDGHGTNVSGIASAATDNGAFVAGVGWQVSLMEARVFPHCPPDKPFAHASSNDIAAGIDWAVANGAKVINLSLGSDQSDDVYEEPAVANALSRGVVVVAAAGNGDASGAGRATLVYPAADPGVISVGSSAIRDVTPNSLTGATEYVAGYSDYGPGPNGPLDVVAPGGDPTQSQTSCQDPSCVDYLQWILNLYSTTAVSQSGHTRALFAGTSQATAHVSGVVGLMLSKLLAEGRSLSPAQVRAIIDASADNIRDSHQGHGRINALRALQATP
jgi:thermitase